MTTTVNKRMRSLSIALILIVSFVLLAPAADIARADTYSETPKTLVFGTTYTGTISTTADKYRYNFKLTKPSRVTVSGKLTDPNGDVCGTTLRLCKASGTDSELKHPTFDSDKGKCTYTYTYYLTKGSYCFIIDASSQGNAGDPDTFTLKATRKNVTATSVLKVRSAKKRYAKVTWGKRSAANGYQVQVARNSKFTKGCKTKTITKKGTGSYTFKKLAAGKKYYTRVRTYTKTVDGKRAYSAWSKVKKVTVRKR